MSIMTDVALITITHDPTGENIELFQRLHKNIEKLYSELFITISEESSSELVETFKQSKFNYKIIPKKGAAEARRAVVEFGLTGKSHYYHYCDFDRLLTWATSYLSELDRTVKSIPDHEYQIIGRTARAMNTHPEEWVETEKITNKICSMELGMNVDITAGSCSFSRSVADYINRYSKDQMTDAEWAMIAKRIAGQPVSYSSVEGLEYQEELNGIRRNISEAEKWLGRLKLSTVISESAIRTGK